MSALRGCVLLGRSVRGFSRCQALWTVPAHYSTFTVASRHSYLHNGPFLKTQSAGVHADSAQSKINDLITITDEPDTLYNKIEVLAKCHDKTVLDSYEYFAVLAAKELGIPVEKVCEPLKKIERFTLLKSVHIFKKHRVQYEMRTHYRAIELKHLTGSTADVYLEYIQRNLPEGVTLEITKTTLLKLPDHIKNPVWDQLPNEDNTRNS
ncbi:small ribosomal subunit protein uS10m isoform X2 [Ascaphus truei]|uniref:small ribosomal subunit protein uS10m isoform X2 n=1 Tax=Ascaphus truei TaxID=8439 RepID=UPI003F598396